MKRKKILIVEDEVITAMDLMTLMEDWGYDFLEPAASGEEAIKRVEEEAPDLVLMDVSLPHKNGIEAAREICARIRLPIIFTSGYPEEELAEKIELPCPYGYVTKPLDFDELKAKIDSFILP
jgi:CheY-like chemotaxis protein